MTVRVQGLGAVDQAPAGDIDDLRRVGCVELRLGVGKLPWAEVTPAMAAARASRSELYSLRIGPNRSRAAVADAIVDDIAAAPTAFPAARIEACCWVSPFTRCHQVPQAFCGSAILCCAVNAPRRRSPTSEVRLCLVEPCLGRRHLGG